MNASPRLPLFRCVRLLAVLMVSSPLLPAATPFVHANINTSTGLLAASPVTFVGASFYGTTLRGGLYNQGTIYRGHLNTGTLEIVHNFNNAAETTGQGGAYGELMLASDGYLYGTANINNFFITLSSIIYRLRPDGSDYSVLHTFAPKPTLGGNALFGSLVEGTDGRLYGMTARSGEHDGGNIFRMDKNGANFTTLFQFPKTGPTGWWPQGGLLKTTTGELFGTTSEGGTHANGSLFRLNSNGTVTVLHAFTGGAGGGRPMGTVSETDEGRLLGVCYDGGANSAGGVFLADPDGTDYTLIFSFPADPALGRAGGFQSAIMADDGLIWSALRTQTTTTLYSITTTGGNFTTYALSGDTLASPRQMPAVVAVPPNGMLHYSEIKLFIPTTNVGAPGVGYIYSHKITIPKPALIPEPLPNAIYGKPYSFTFHATNEPKFWNMGLLAGQGSGFNLTIGYNTGVISGTVTGLGDYQFRVSASRDSYFIFNFGSAIRTLHVDPCPVAYILSGLNRTYDGNPKEIGIATSPAEALAYSVTYNGSTTKPVAAGTYAVVITNTQYGFTGGATATLTIAPVAATFTLGSLTQPYDGTPKSPSATVNPTAAGVKFTYNGSATAPTNPGTYTVVATPLTSNYTGSATGTFIITDSVPPVLSLPTNLTVEATGAAGAIATFTGTATDNVNGNVPIAFTPPSGAVFPLGNTTVTATALDAAGNRATGNFIVTVRDTVAPTLNLPANLTRSATSPAGAVVTFAVSATDLVNGNVAASATPPSGSTFGLGTTTVQVNASDAAGNIRSGSFTVTVADLTPPVIAVQPNFVVEATSSAGAVATFAPTATDAVSAVTVTVAPASGSTFPLGATLATITARDAAGNTSSSTFTVTVRDTTAPTLSVPANQIVEATSAAGASATFSASASDLVNGSVAVVASAPSGSVFPLGVTTVGLTASDTAGNPATGSFTVTVVDTIAPTITAQADLVVEAASAAGAPVTFSTTASDPVSAATVTTAPTSGSVFPLGTSTVTITARDATGNTSTSTFNVTVRDTVAPVVTAPANQVVEATSSAGAVVTYTATASDAVSGALSVVGSPASGSTFALGTTTVGLAASDAAGNTGTASFTVTVVDTTAPVIAALENLVVEATSASGTTVSFTATASDSAGLVTITTSPASGSVFPLGSSTVAITARDAAGNTATSSFTVTVRDTTGPVITTTDTIVAEATSAAGATVTFTSSATDLVSGTVTATATPASGSVFPIGNTTVSVTAIDTAGNRTTDAFTVTVRDTTAPVLTAPASQTIEATSAAGAPAEFAATATDAVGATLSYSRASGGTFALGVTTVTVSAADAAGNRADASFTITVRDTTRPVLTLPSNLTLEATSAAGSTGTFAASATDTVSGNLAVALSHASGATFAIGTTTVTASAVDTAGNTVSGSFTLTVRDTTAPALAPIPNQTLEATSAAGAVATFSATATDAVGANVTTSHASGSTFPIGTTPVTVVATDAAGNTTHGGFTITVRDASSPVISSLTASITSILQPNKKMVPVTLTANASDLVGVTSLKIVSVTSNEPDSKTVQWQITGPLTLNLLADREGKGSGRIYTITVEARDAAGNTTTLTTTVAVPHDQRK